MRQEPRLGQVRVVGLIERGPHALLGSRELGLALLRYGDVDDVALERSALVFRILAGPADFARPAQFLRYGMDEAVFEVIDAALRAALPLGGEIAVAIFRVDRVVPEIDVGVAVLRD